MTTTLSAVQDVEASSRRPGIRLRGDVLAVCAVVKAKSAPSASTIVELPTV